MKWFERIARALVLGNGLPLLVRAILKESDPTLKSQEPTDY